MQSQEKSEFVKEGERCAKESDKEADIRLAHKNIESDISDIKRNYDDIEIFHNKGTVVCRVRMPFSLEGGPQEAENFAKTLENKYGYKLRKSAPRMITLSANKNLHVLVRNNGNIKVVKKIKYKGNSYDLISQEFANAYYMMKKVAKKEKFHIEPMWYAKRRNPYGDPLPEKQYRPGL